jgi:hypothetical protein
MRPKHFQPQRGCITVAQNRCNPFRVDSSLRSVPGVAAARQRRADRWNPVGILSVSPQLQTRAIVARLDALRGKLDELQRLQREVEAELASFTPALLAKAFRGEL